MGQGPNLSGQAGVPIPSALKWGDVLAPSKPQGSTPPLGNTNPFMVRLLGAVQQQKQGGSDASDLSDIMDVASLFGF